MDGPAVAVACLPACLPPSPISRARGRVGKGRPPATRPNYGILQDSGGQTGKSGLNHCDCSQQTRALSCTWPATQFCRGLVWSTLNNSCITTMRIITLIHRDTASVGWSFEQLELPTQIVWLRREPAVQLGKMFVVRRFSNLTSVSTRFLARFLEASHSASTTNYCPKTNM